MADKAHETTDKMLEEMEQKLKKIYSDAQKDISQKIDSYFKQFKTDDAKMRKKLENGKITEDQYKSWEQQQLMTGKHWDDMKKQIAHEMTSVNKTAISYINGKLPDVYTVNYNAIQDQTSGLKGFAFELVDASTVKNLATSDKTLLPYKRIDGRKDERWNTKQVNSQVMQGILQGESVSDIAKRLEKSLPEMNYSSAVRNARTTVTSAENKGRMDSYHEAKELGIVMKKVWLCTHDGRTRPEHNELDGKDEDVDKPFVNGFGEIMYPGDPDADPANVYNCRCTLVSEIKGFKTSSGKINYLDGKGGIQHNIVNGEDIFDTWKRRKDEFDYAIEDIINAQGFNGLPKIVSADEFDKAVQESNFIAQRTYSAPDQETLDAYRNQLYYGDWYVDCSNGGCAYGKGMYSAYANNTEVTEYIKREMKGYGARRGIDYNYIETFTLTPDARTITPNEIIELRQLVNKKIMAEFKERGGWGSSDAIEWASEHDINGLDDGSFAALMGYDAILTHGIDDYAIILNRTKVIFKEP